MIRFRLMGPLARYTGYAVGFRGMVRKLAQRGDLLIDLRATKEIIPPDTEQYLHDLLNSGREHRQLGVNVGFPPFLADLGTRYKILYSMYEANDIPFEWKCHVEQANEVWVPTKFCASVFGQYNRKIRLVPWGIDTDVYKPRYNRTTNDVCVFGAVGVQSARKGTDVMMKAFNRAFGESGQARLIIKTRDTRWRKMPAFSNKYIEVIDDDWPEERLVKFYHEIDCLLGPSRGEGVLMSPLQAAFCGTPSLVTNWSGPSDYIDEKGIYGIRTAGLSRARNIGAEGAFWAEPDVDHLVELMRWVAEKRPDVQGDYSRWTLNCQRDHIVSYLKSAWERMGG